MKPFGAAIETAAMLREWGMPGALRPPDLPWRLPNWLRGRSAAGSVRTKGRLWAFTGRLGTLWRVEYPARPLSGPSGLPGSRADVKTNGALPTDAVSSNVQHLGSSLGGPSLGCYLIARSFKG